MPDDTYAIDSAGSYDLGRRRVRRMGYGAMQLAGDNVLGPARDRDEALRVLRIAVAEGVNHIDTAQFYGPGVVNELIREALHPYPAAVNPRLMDGSEPGARFGAQLASLIKARDEGLIEGIGLSNISVRHLLRAVEQTEIVCV